jgi:cyclic di-GMP phosphodiesterase
MIENVIKLIGILVHMREPYDDHGEHVAAIAVRFCAALGIEGQEAEQIRIGAHIHDVGKLIIRPELINMPRNLALSERAEVQSHTSLGYAAVKKAGYGEIIQDIVHYHHEAWDGSGYPAGLREEFIPPAARVIALCDVYEALRARRPYRDPFSYEMTKAIMIGIMGKNFDPKMLSVFFDKVATGDTARVDA